MCSLYEVYHTQNTSTVHEDYMKATVHKAGTVHEDYMKSNFHKRGTVRVFYMKSTIHQTQVQYMKII